MGEAVERFNEVRKAADQLGTTPEIFSALGFAVGRFGVDSEGLVTASRHMDKFISQARQGVPQASALMSHLGLSAEELAAAPLDEQFKAFADGLASLDEVDRQRATLEVFGKSAGNLAPLMRKGAAGITELVDKAKDIGAIVTKEDAENAKKFSGSLGLIKASIHFLVESVGASVLPEMAEQMKQVADYIVPVVKGIRLFIEENRGLVVGILAVGTAIGIAGTVLTGIGSALAVAAFAAGGFAAALTAVGAVIGFLTATPVLIGAALATAGVMALGLVADFGDLEGILGTLTRVWEGFAEVVGSTFRGVTDALKAGDLQLAFKVAVAGLDVIWKGLLYGLQVGWTAFKNSFIEGWYDVLTEIKIVAAKAARELANVFGAAASATPSLQAQAAIFGRLFGGARSEDEIRAADAKAKADRLAGRAAADMAAALDLAKAKLEQEGAVRDALVAKNTALFAKEMAEIANTPIRFPGGAAPPNLSGLSVAGQFGSNLARMAFGAGGAGDKIAKNTKDTADGIKRIEDKIGGLPVN
jgi:hypothetical protein